MSGKASSGGGTRPQPTIVIRRIRKGGHGGHHGGAWKIAYADFVTAMMAFFLLMWLLGSTAQGDLNGIAEYYQSPLKVALTGGGGSGASNNLVKGGGPQVTRTHGGQPRDAEEAARRQARLQALRAELNRQDAQRMRDLQARIETVLESDPALRPLRRQLRLEITPDGLRVQIVDDQGRPMFDSGSSQVNPHLRALLRSLGGVLQSAQGRLVLSGHTDASPYAGGERGYSNWELSADRANASRRELVAGGLGEDRLVRVMGLGSSVPFEADPLGPLNRRMSILVLGRIGQERWAAGGDTPISETEALERLLDRGAPAPANPPSSLGEKR